MSSHQSAPLQIVLYKHWINGGGRWSGAFLLLKPGFEMQLIFSSAFLKREIRLFKEARIAKTVLISPHFRGGEWPTPRENKIEKALVLLQEICGLRLQLQQLWGSLNDLRANYLLLLAFGV